MEYYVCYNPECGNHIQISKSQDDMPTAIIRHGDFNHIEDEMIKRYVYVDKKKDRRLFLCDVCHSAVELITRGE